MVFLKEAVAAFSDPRPHGEAFRSLLHSLRNLGLQIEREDSAAGEIVARCLSLCFNMGLWRCWSDKLLLEVRDAGDDGSAIGVYALPNLTRWRVRKGEQVHELGQLVSALRRGAEQGQ